MNTETNSTCDLFHLTIEQKQFFKNYSWWVETIGNLSFGSFGLFLNLVTIIILSSSTMWNNFFNRLLICLAVFDILYLSCEISEVFRHRHNTFLQQKMFVNLVYPMRNIFMFSSVYMTVVLAFERYQAITDPVKYRVKMVGTTMNSQLLINVVPGILFSILYYIPKFFDLNVGEELKCYRSNLTNVISDGLEEEEEKDGLTSDLDFNCTTNYIFVPTKLRLNPQYIFWYIIVSNLTLTAVLPSVALMYLNARIMASLNKFRDRKKSLQSRNSITTCNSEYHSASGPKTTNTDLKKTFILFGIVILFVLCHSLRVSLNINEFIEIATQKVMENGKRCSKESIWKEYAIPFNQLLVIINSSLNFFIYVFFDNGFQQVLRKHLHIQNPFRCTCINREDTRYDNSMNKTRNTDIELQSINNGET